MMKAANIGYFEDEAESRAAEEGILRPKPEGGGARAMPLEKVRLARGTEIYRIVSTLPRDPFPQRENYRNERDYDDKYAAWQARHSEEHIWAWLRSGSWWFCAEQLTKFKHASLENGVPLTDVGRRALAVAEAWNNAEFLIRAKVVVDLILAYGGRGKTQYPREVFGSVEVVTVLIPNPDVTQLYIPGLNEHRNAIAWLNLEERQRLR